MAPRLVSHETSRGALVLSVALVPLFVHADFQPSVDVGSLTLRVADAAVLAVVASAIAAAKRDGTSRLRPGLPIWLTAVGLFAAIALSMLVATTSARAYPFGEHLVTAAKFAEYAALALAVPLIIRTERDLRLVIGTVVALGVAAAAVGVLQISGLPLFDEWPAGRRQPSFLGHHDFAALAGATLTAGFILRGRLALVAWTAGAVGLVVSGAVTGGAGLVLAATVLVASLWRSRTLERRHAFAVLLTVAAVLAGIVGIRSANIAELFDDRTGDVETFSHRGVLAYLGVRQFADHPVIGAGWHASFDEATYGRYLDDARARYPSQPDEVFPSPEQPWGIQNAYLQALADLGGLGTLALLALVAAGAATGLRAAGGAATATRTAALTGTLWLCIVLGIWNGIGLIAGLPLDALLWLALGLAAAAAAEIADE